jgi:hypothetical protein
VYAETITQLSKMFDLAERTVVPRTGLRKTPECCFDGIGGWTSDTLIFRATGEEFNLRFPACEKSSDESDTDSSDESDTDSPNLDEYSGITSDINYTGDALWSERCPTLSLPSFFSCGKLYKVAGMGVYELPVMLVLIRLYHFGYGSYCTPDCQVWCGAQLVGCNVQLKLGLDEQNLVFEDRRFAKISGPLTPCSYFIDADNNTDTERCGLEETLLPAGYFDNQNNWAARHVGFIVRGSSAKIDLTMKVTVTGEDQFFGDAECLANTEGLVNQYTMGGMGFDIECVAITEKAAESALAAWIARDTPEEPAP